MTKTDLIQVSEFVRVEKGFVLKRALATEELLDNLVTASHYKVGNRDAKNKLIELGKEIWYVDYKGPMVWYVFKAFLDSEVTASLGKDWYRYKKISTHHTKEEALAAAQLLL